MHAPAIWISDRGLMSVVTAQTDGTGRAGELLMASGMTPACIGESVHTGCAVAVLWMDRERG